MKKSLPPPENWQDFESLCKKLFGEIWQCPHTIKKNGRLGQPQAGVDVYGKPKGETEYWGIQCKGKDNYENKKLTETEIEEEIAKALTFEPKLKTFIFTTTASKDVHIEKYVRLKDIESCKNGGFEIVLYSWQDLVDLIQENRDTFNWYVNNIQFKEKFDVEVTINTGNEENILNPVFLKTIKRFEKNDDWASPILNSQLQKLQAPWMNRPYVSMFGSNEINKAWCELSVSVKNTGSVVLEDWKFWLRFPETIRGVDDDFTKDIFALKELIKYRTTWADKDEKNVLYRPLNNHPLIQKDNRTFKCFCKISHEEKTMQLKWHLLARDFDREGTVELNIKPEFKEIIETITVYEGERTEVLISDYKEKRK